MKGYLWGYLRKNKRKKLIENLTTVINVKV